MEHTQIIGFVAGIMTTIAFVPQVTRIWKTRSAKDVSFPAFVVFTLGVAMWLLYGLLIGEPAIALWNAVTLVLAAAILWMKIKFD